MKKFFRNLTSGYSLVLFLLLIEVLFVLFVQLFSDEIAGWLHIENEIWYVFLYLGIRLAVFIIALIIFFRIVNKPEDPEFKIPWIVGMLLLPFFCSVLFLIFGNHGLRKKDKVLITASRNAYNAHFKLSEKQMLQS